MVTGPTAVPGTDAVGHDHAGPHPGAGAAVAAPARLAARPLETICLKCLSVRPHHSVTAARRSGRLGRSYRGRCRSGASDNRARPHRRGAKLWPLVPPADTRRCGGALARDRCSCCSGVTAVGVDAAVSQPAARPSPGRRRRSTRPLACATVRCASLGQERLEFVQPHEPGSQRSRGPGGALDIERLPRSCRELKPNTAGGAVRSLAQ